MKAFEQHGHRFGQFPLRVDLARLSDAERDAPERLLAAAEESGADGPV